MLIMPNIPNANRLAALMHPSRQNMIISEVFAENDLMKTYTLKASNKHELAYFTAGSYVPVFVEIDGNIIERPYALASSPKDALYGEYKISVKKANNGYVSNYIYNNWNVGTSVVIGGPLPGENYVPVRDRENIIALAGGIGITPFHSMAKAICEGDVVCKLTLFYCVNTIAEAAYTNEWKELEKSSNGKFKVIMVVANETIDGYEHGFISLDIIEKYASINESSIFVSGPEKMVDHIKKSLKPLNIPRRFVRFGMSGDSGFNQNDRANEKVMLTVHYAGEIFSIPAMKNKTILTALEEAKLTPAVHCRTGICGFCRSYVINGEFEVAIDETGMRARDKELGYLHPCCSYPETDMEIIIHRA